MTRQTPTISLIATLALAAPATEALETVSVGVLCPLTTPSKSFGIAHLQGVTLAVEEWNQNPGNGPLIRLRIADDLEATEQGKAMFAELATEGVVAILGPCNSSVALQLLDDITRLHVPA